MIQILHCPLGVKSARWISTALLESNEKHLPGVGTNQFRIPLLQSRISKVILLQVASGSYNLTRKMTFLCGILLLKPRASKTKSCYSDSKRMVFLRSYVELNSLKYALAQLPLKSGYSIKHNEVFTIPGKTLVAFTLRN